MNDTITRSPPGSIISPFYCFMVSIVALNRLSLQSQTAASETVEESTLHSQPAAGVTVEQSSLRLYFFMVCLSKEHQHIYKTFVKYTVFIIVGFMNTTCGFHKHYTLAHC